MRTLTGFATSREVAPHVLGTGCWEFKGMKNGVTKTCWAFVLFAYCAVLLELCGLVIYPKEDILFLIIHGASKRVS